MKVAYKEFTFDSAHYLPKYEGKCARTHGHTYRLKVGVKETNPANDMIIDFVTLKNIVNQYVLEKYDHRLLNQFPEYRTKRPTAENMVVDIWNLLIPELPNLYEVVLYETPTSYITYKGTE